MKTNFSAGIALRSVPHWIFCALSRSLRFAIWETANGLHSASAIGSNPALLRQSSVNLTGGVLAFLQP
ncbi:MAG TPA: hypothetical protein VG498_09625, partial [Terriglobales bacterium]|nr:hypothetical protein [Terriglobales bacterium]